MGEFARRTRLAAGHSNLPFGARPEPDGTPVRRWQAAQGPVRRTKSARTRVGKSLRAAVRIRHPGESRDPEPLAANERRHWAQAFAGATSADAGRRESTARTTRSAGRRPDRGSSCAGGHELLLLGRTLERDGRGLAALDGLGHRVEVAGADLALVLDRGEALVGRRELGLLQLDEGAHLVPRVAVGEVEHRIVEGVEAGQGDELEAVSVGRELALEAR